AISVDELDRKSPQRATSQAVLKWLVDAAHRNGMRLREASTYQYVRYNEGRPSYTITKQIVLLQRGAKSTIEIPFKKIVHEPWMEDDLVTCVERHRPVDVEGKLLALAEKVPGTFDRITEVITDLC